MLMLNNRLKKLGYILQAGKNTVGTYRHHSYSQAGEDLIIDFILANYFNTRMPSYLDVGAYAPIKFSNTYLFYERGASGVLVEPDHELARTLQQKRPRDTVLNIGITDRESEVSFYLMNPPTLNTFSKKEYEQYKLFYPESSLRRIIKTKTEPLNNVLEKYSPMGLDLLSIDVEGLDYQILTSVDFRRWRPTIICIESVEYSRGNTLTKVTAIKNYLIKNGYFLYADTFINGIFVDKKRWTKLNQPKLSNFEGR